VQKVKIGVAHRGAGLAPVFAAVEGGYLREQGLEPELVSAPGHAGALQSLIAGEVDFINSVGPAVILANARHNGDAAVIASASARSTQQICARPGLTSRDELRGKRWGVTARNDPDECTILMAFERWNWSIADVDIVVVGSDRPRLELLLNADNVDVAIMHAPEPFQARKRGWNVVEDLARMDVAMQNSCAVTTRRLLKERPDTALRYARAYCKGVYRFRTDAEFGLALLRKYLSESDEAVLKQTWLALARAMGGMMFPSVEGMRNAGGLLHRLGALTKPVSSEDAIDLELIATAEREGFFETFMGRP